MSGDERDPPEPPVGAAGEGESGSGRRRRVRFDMDAGAAPRATPERVKTARRRSAQSARWIERQINDPYVRRAKAEGWRARAAFKLLELDERFAFVPRQGRVIDLGAAPGGWSQVVAARGARALVGIDLLHIEPLQGAVFVQGDFLEPGMAERLMDLAGGPVDLVMSDMAANTVGHRQTDHLRTQALTEAAAAFALDVLAPGGAFVAKAFRGGGEAELIGRLKRAFRSVRHAKPPSSRPESVETFIVAQGFRGGPGGS